MRKHKGILFAADIPDKNILISLLQDIEPCISAVKIGNLVLYQNSWSIIKEIKNKINLPIIADLKLLDMPNMAGRITKDAINAGIDGVTVAGSIGIEGIQACRNILKDKLLFVFTQFTHCGGLIDDSEANKYIKYASSLGCDGIQVPATKKGRIKEVRKKVGRKLMIISCGIGTQNFYDSEFDGPAIGSAIRDGADYEIIGRSIYSAQEIGITPRHAAEEAFNIIKKMS